MKVTFEGVGRNKATWTAECAKLEYEWLYRQVKRNAAVLSADLDFVEVGVGVGRIFAGMRPIGMFRFSEDTL